MQPSIPSYTYAFSQVAMREALVFKSIVGLLAGRTSAHWEHIEQGVPRLLVIGSDAGAPVGDAKSAQQSVCLYLGSLGDAAKSLTLPLPLRPNEVLERLERVSHLLQGESFAHEETEQVSFRLKSWPSAELIAGRPQLMRLAALLNARPLSLRELSERSQVPVQVCRDFVRTLKQKGLLAQEQVAATEFIEPPKKGFFARLRAHLGFTGQKGSGQ